MVSRADSLFADVYELDADFFGTQVRIQRATWIGSPVTAIVGEIENEIAARKGGMRIEREWRDYEFAVADYIVNGKVVDPQVGDTIHETINGVACRFKVTPTNTLRAIERLDSDGVRWLVRAKLVKEA